MKKKMRTAGMAHVGGMYRQLSISFNFENVSPLQVLLIQIYVYDVVSV